MVKLQNWNFPTKHRGLFLNHFKETNEPRFPKSKTEKGANENLTLYFRQNVYLALAPD